MATKIKGFYKKFKISQIFGAASVKEREIEIGYPTDVKHVTHIGWDGQSGSAPNWMNEYKTASDFAATSIGNIHETKASHSAISTWSSQDFESIDRQPASSELFNDVLVADIPDIPKKQKRKKSKSTSFPKFSLRSSASKAKLVEDNVRAPNVVVM